MQMNTSTPTQQMKHERRIGRTGSTGRTGKTGVEGRQDHFLLSPHSNSNFISQIKNKKKIPIRKTIISNCNL